MRTEPERRARYLILGCGGMLGCGLRAVLDERRHAEDTSPTTAYEALTHAEMDITDIRLVNERLGAFGRELGNGVRGVVLNAAAYTDVERAEDEPRQAYAVNERGPSALAVACVRHGLRLVHVSTDFVFDGEKDGPYTEEDEPDPLSVYGASKLAGERAVLAGDPSALVIRTSWVYGPGGTNFPRKIVDLASHGVELRVVSDEAGSPTYAPDLARGLLELERQGLRGLFHLAGTGSSTRYQLASAALAAAGLEAKMIPVGGDEFPTKARRPRNSVLDSGKARRFGVELPFWKDSLREYVASL